MSAFFQPLVLTRLADWCVWAPPNGPTTIGESEADEVAWCTKAGRGTRLIPAGAITGVQFMKTPSYLEVIAFIDQTQLDMAADDFGGELDPHGADLVSAIQRLSVACHLTDGDSVVTPSVPSCSRTTSL